MANVLVKYTSLVEQPIERGWDRTSGQFAVRRWNGTKADCDAKLAALRVALGYSSLVVREIAGGVHQIEARIDAGVDANGDPLVDESEGTQDSWELSAGRVEKDLLSSDTAAIEAISDDNMCILRDFADGKLSYSDYIGVSPAFTGGTASAANDIWELMRRGVKSVTVYAPTLRKNQTASNGYVLASALSGVGLVWSTAGVLATEAVPASIANNLPASSAITGYAYGWLKGFPQITDTVGGKVQLQQEWEWGLWSTVIYTAAV